MDVSETLKATDYLIFGSNLFVESVSVRLVKGIVVSELC